MIIPLGFCSDHFFQLAPGSDEPAFGISFHLPASHIRNCSFNHSHSLAKAGLALSIVTKSVLPLVFRAHVSACRVCNVLSVVPRSPWAALVKAGMHEALLSNVLPTGLPRAGLCLPRVQRSLRCIVKAGMHQALLQATCCRLAFRAQVSACRVCNVLYVVLSRLVCTKRWN